MSQPVSDNRRVLLVDDNEAIHGDFRRILEPESSGIDDLDAAAADFFGETENTAPASPHSGVQFTLDSALQGQEALSMVTAARSAGKPYALAFVDMRMPPGWDGLTTITKLWEVDPDLLVVICTAYSDRSWTEIQTTLAERHRWLVLKKPFDKVEVLQLAHSLTEKWNLGQIARQRQATLETMVEARTEQLTRALQVKNEFLSNISHELLTPMNGLVGLQAILAETALNDEQRDLLNESSACADNLLRMLQQILAYNQAESGKLALDPIDFSPAAVLQEVCEVFAARAAHKGLALKVDVACDLPETVAAPKAVIVEILRMLVDNAVKFTEHGTVTLTASGGGDAIRFTVTDTGIGLATDELEWISIPFAQVDGGKTRRFGGIGLGLALTRRLAASLGGELVVSSEPGRGTQAEFAVRIMGESAVGSAA